MQEKGDINYIKWFSELNKNSVGIAGGKGANLAEIYNLKIPVPPGFVITTDAYTYFLEDAHLKNEIKQLLDKINYENTEEFDEITAKIRKLIIDAKIPEDLEEEIIDAYDGLGADYSSTYAHEIIKKKPESQFVAVRSSATAEDLDDASFAGQQDSFTNVKGNEQLLESIKKCFASLFTSRATYYRNKKGFKQEETKLAVVIQKMINSDKSGVVFSTDPSYNNDNIIIESVYGLGEGIVSGEITPDKYIISRQMVLLNKKISEKKIAITRNSGGQNVKVKLTDERSKSQVLKDFEIKKLAQISIKLEEHYQKPQDIEFAIESGEVYIVQTRSITTIKKRIDRQPQKIEGEIILEGLAASPGIASGKVKIVKTLEDLEKIKKGDVLVTKMTNPDMVVAMQRASAIVTDEGGLTAHAAIVSREMGIPSVVGTEEATIKLQEGEIITIDGYHGKIFGGKIGEGKQKEIEQVKVSTKTKIKVIVDLPSFAERASKTGIKEVGLLRIEGIIAESGKHPNYFLKQNKIKDYEEVVFKGVNAISKYFTELWVRTSDIRSDEFRNLDGAPKEIEANPMLGMHGIRFGIKYPEILKAELRALKRVAEGNKRIGVMMPQIISVDEVRGVKKLLREINANNLKLGIMVETPAAVQLIKDLCEEGIKFLSFGTNDLTQYILAVDRGNEEVQSLYNEIHPAVLYQLGFVIRVAKRYKVETSICGQAGSKREMVKFLVEKGIDSISVNADVASEIADYINQVEKSMGNRSEEDKVYLKPVENPKSLDNFEESEKTEIKERQKFHKK